MNSLEENRVLNICTKIPAALSVLCSSYVSYSILTNQQKRSSQTQRIVLGISCADILSSFFFFLSTWLIPRGTPQVYGAVGNTQTCELQGFFIQLSIMAPMYNGLLALYCYLYVCKDWGKQRMNYVEFYGHILVIVFSLSLAIAFLALDLYNSWETFCWVFQYPFDCTQSFQITTTSEEEDGITTTTTNCIRGDNASLYQVVSYAIIWVNIFWTFWSTVQVYRTIRHQEKKMEAYIQEYSSSDDNNNTTTTRNNNSDSRNVAIRGGLFTCAFLCNYLPATLCRLAAFFVGSVRFPLQIVGVTFTPAQGIFNFFVYIIHPAVSRCLKERREARRIRRGDDTRQQLANNKQVVVLRENATKDDYDDSGAEEEPHKFVNHPAT